MKSNLSFTIAACFAASAATLVAAQATTGETVGSVIANPPVGVTALSDAGVPTKTPDPNAPAGPAVPYVDGIVASTYVKDGEYADLANRIVQALNADPSLKDCKITVQPEKGFVLLTGSVATQHQARLATELANGQVGDGMVVSEILPDHINYKSPTIEMHNASILTSEPKPQSGEQQTAVG